MAWRLAQSLATLRAEIDRLAPGRSKRSDGTIGDQAHASRASRHNPNRHGVVTALDITHDPAGGCDIHAIARRIVQHPHPELAYVISNGQIAKRATGFRWERYTGASPHTQHAHFAVGEGPDRDPRPPYDSTQPWGVRPAVVAGVQIEEDDMPLTDQDLDRIAARVWARKIKHLTQSTQPAELVVSDIAIHARAAAKQMDPAALAEELARRLPRSQGPVSVADLEAALRTVLGSLDD